MVTLIDIGDMTKDNLTYVLQSWLRLYFETRDFAEAQLMVLKVMDALRMKVEGKEILSKPLADDLAEAFDRYTKLKFMQSRPEYSDSEDIEAELQGPKQAITRAFNKAIWNIKEDVLNSTITTIRPVKEEFQARVPIIKGDKAKKKPLLGGSEP